MKLAFCRYYSLGNYPQTLLQFFCLAGLYSSFMGKKDLCSGSLWDERSIKPREQAYPKTASPSRVFFLTQRALSLLPGPTVHHPPEGGPHHLVSAPDLRVAKGCWRWWTEHDCAGCIDAHRRTSERRGQSSQGERRDMDMITLQGWKLDLLVSMPPKKRRTLDFSLASKSLWGYNCQGRRIEHILFNNL